MINKNDLDELKRMVTNFYGDDKILLNKALREISALTAEVSKLKAENEVLRKRAAVQQ